MQVENNRRRNGRIWTGLFLTGIGSVLLLKQFGVFFPDWFFTWPVLLIAIGVLTGLKHRFQGPAWLVLILIGSIFLFDQFDPDINLRKYALPIAFIAFGLMIIFRPKKMHDGFDWKNEWRKKAGYPVDEPIEKVDVSPETEYKGENFIDSVAIFGSVRKVILSKDFKGGDLVAIFGGNEIDLSQADIQTPVTIEFVQIMGGSKLIVPAHWEIKSEMVAIFGGIEDKRRSTGQIYDPTKVVILKGTTIFGGIDIKNY